LLRKNGEPPPVATPRPALGHAVDPFHPDLAVALPRSATIRGIGRALVLGAATTVALALLPGIAVADPEDATSAAQAAQLVARAGHELEVLTEQVNEARETLAQQQAAVDGARHAAAEAQEQLRALDGHIRQVARAAFTGDGMTELDLLMISRSAEEFLSRLAILDAIAGHTSAVLADVAESAVAAEQTRTAADAAQAAAQRTLEDVTAQQARLESDIADYQAQYHALSALEQEAVAAAHNGEEVATAVPAGEEVATAAPGGEEVATAAPAGEEVAAPAPAGEEVAAPAPAVEAAAIAAPAPAASSAAQIAVDTALAQVGDAYIWGAGGPDAFDCSGLTQYAYAAAGITLPHSSRMQAAMGTAVSRANLQPGDLIFYYSPISHVSMYVGNGKMVHASTFGQPVKVVGVDSMGGITAMRRIA
jgi:cell wall-associated NlpC family hydrolase